MSKLQNGCICSPTKLFQKVDFENIPSGVQLSRISSFAILHRLSVKNQAGN